MANLVFKNHIKSVLTLTLLYHKNVLVCVVLIQTFMANPNINRPSTDSDDEPLLVRKS